MVRFLVVAAAVSALGPLAACKDKNKSEGLPPAQEWSANAGGAMPPTTGPASPHGPANPHAQAGQEGQEGLPEGHPPVDDVHERNGGGGGSPDVGAMGLKGPDPNRPINPNNHVKGVIKVHPKAKD